MEINLAFAKAAQEIETQNKEVELQKAASQMEGLFLYHLLRVMRQSMVGDEEGGLGRSIQMSLFDWEVAKELSAKRGLGLREMIESQLKKDLQKGLNLSTKMPIKK